jgi:hypothetical protein
MDPLKRDTHGFFFDDPLADWACCLAMAVACFALALLVPLGGP